jgi:uncharacterized protein (DUF2252 family)
MILNALPHAAHAELNLSAHRDPIGILHQADADRVPTLIPIRYGRMLRSPFAFFRGAAAVMAADLARTPVTGLKVQMCGDCHLKNFGGFATPERNIVFDINDFDETLPGPWEWDVKRLVASFVLAMRENDLGEAAEEIAASCARAYRKAIRDFSELDPLTVWYSRFTAKEFLESLNTNTRERVERRIEKARKQGGSDIDYPKLAEVVDGEIHIKENPPLIFRPDVAQTPEFALRAHKILEDYRETLADDRRVLFDRYRFVDAAFKVVGVGSVGTRCWIALLMSATNEPLFLQFKQAHPSVLEPYAGASSYKHAGQRVVMGQRLMQAASDIFLGWTTGPAGDYYVRQLRDAKVSVVLETFDESMFASYAKACGRNLARAHAKSGEAAAIAGQLGKSREFDEAIAAYAKAYADLTERDYAALKLAVKAGKIEVYIE